MLRPALVLFAVGCATSGAPTPQYAEAPDPELGHSSNRQPAELPEPGSSESDSSNPNSQPEMQVTPLGFSEGPRVSSAENNTQNARALRLLRAGNLQDAEELLRVTLAADETNALVAFNLVSVLSLAGEIDEAASLMREWLTRDLPTLRSRYAHDPDLENLRQSSRGAELERHIQQLGGRFRNARGVHLVAYDARLVEDASGMTHEVPYTQAGIYDEATARFIPRGPRLPRSLLSYHDAANGVVLTVTGVNDNDGLGHIRDQHIHAYWTSNDAVSTLDGENDGSCTLIRLNRERVLARCGSIHAELVDGTWRVPTDADENWHVRSRPLVAPRAENYEWAIDVWNHSGTVSETHAAFRGNAVEWRGTRYALGRGHAASTRHHQVATDDSLWVISMRGPCRDGRPSQRYFIDRVDLSSGEVERIDEGEGTAFVRAFGGTVYLQINDTTRVYAGALSDEYTQLPPRLRLVVPSGSSCGG